MDITFSYRVTALKKVAELNGLTDVVTKVSFIYSGQSGETLIEYPLADISVPTPDTQSFVALADLTEQEVISWIEGSYPIGPLTDAITLQINELLNPIQEVSTLPWQVV
jgi:hypothetical protein